MVKAGVANDSSADQSSAINALIANTDYNTFYFPAGIYRGGWANARDDMTFIFAPGARFDEAMASSCLPCITYKLLNILCMR